MAGKGYTNKELHKLIMKIHGDFMELRTEVKQTRETIRKYNGLREEIGKLQKKIIFMEARGEGKTSTLEIIRNWGGCFFALITLIILLYNTF
ncbi:hypothetical protein [Oceanobacillus sojae]|uniref:hypothetical protein n=1 Tax=Oceanobacillus sojae TaxID=582851 RepID=UPI0021A2D070|nr:hypothetical protein [Oceanobacillus sojae]MCT1901878.1 hypothetical protein [Oceanobacillus sojae]